MAESSTAGWASTVDRAAVVNNVLRRYKIPRSDNPLGNNVSQALLRWGTDEQRRRYLPGIAHQREIWVQLFSEPGAGSDLAGLSTRAVRDGDQWMVNGQKVWSSWAHDAKFGILLARTDHRGPEAPGPVDLHGRNVEHQESVVRPLRQMTGEAFFNEVFLDDVTVPDDMRIGELGEGWRIASSLLSYERGAAIGGGSAAPSMGVGRTVDALIRHYAPVQDPLLRQRLAIAYSRERIAAWTRQRHEAERRAADPWVMSRRFSSCSTARATRRCKRFRLDLEGINGVAHGDDDAWAATTAYGFLRVRSATIAGGTSEIQRNIMGEKVLGLPREPSAGSRSPVESGPSIMSLRERRPEPTDVGGDVRHTGWQTDPDAVLLLTPDGDGRTYDETR